jgi:hypothetical protein
MSHNVYFILDRDFTGDLWSLSRNSHVWIIRSTCNEAATRLVWNRETDGHSPLQGVTTFDGAEDTSDSFYGYLGTIDDHHGEYSAPEPWDTIHVIGFSLDSARPDRIAEALGVESVLLDPEGGGFAIRRATQQGDAPDDASCSR